MFQTTIGDLAKNLQVEYATASSIVKLMEATGQAKKVGERKSSAGKGKPSSIFEIQKIFTIDLSKKIETCPN